MMEQQKLSLCLNYCRLNRNLVCMHAFEYYHVQVTSHFQDPVLRKLMGVYMSLSPPLICAHIHAPTVWKITLSLSVKSVPTPHTSRYLMLNLFWIDSDIDIAISNILGEQRNICSISLTKQSHISLSAGKKYCYVYPSVVMFIHWICGRTKIYCT